MAAPGLDPCAGDRIRRRGRRRDGRRRGARAVAAIAAVIALYGARTAGGEVRPGYGGTIVGGLLSEPVTLDPVAARSHAELTVVRLVFDTMYRIAGRDPSGQPVVAPHLAAGMPVASADGRELRVPVRAGVTFHDGSALGPDDVVQSLRRLAGSEAGWLLAAVREIRADGQEIVLSLERPMPELAVLLSAPATAITPGGARPSASAIGSGPFKLARLDRRNRRVKLAAANDHFAGRPYVNALDLRWFEDPAGEAREYEAGSSHVSLRGAIAFAGHEPKYQTRDARGPATLLVFVGFGRAHAAVTGHQAFRRALSLALARGAFASVGTGERVVPAVQPLPAALDGPAASASESRAQLERARTSLRQAARAVPAVAAALSGNRTLSFELIIDRTRPDDREIAEKVLAALFRLGLTGSITALDARAFARRRARGECDLYIDQLAAPVASPELAMASAFFAGGSDWPRAQLAAGGLDMARAQRVFAETLPIVPLFHRAVRVHHRSNVRGVEFDDGGSIGFADLFLFGKAVR